MAAKTIMYNPTNITPVSLTESDLPIPRAPTAAIKTINPRVMKRKNPVTTPLQGGTGFVAEVEFEFASVAPTGLATAGAAADDFESLRCDSC